MDFRTIDTDRQLVIGDVRDQAEVSAAMDGIEAVVRGGSYGFRLLFGGVDDREVGQAVALALAHAAPRRFDAFNIMAASALTAADPGRLGTELAAVIEERWPGTLDMLQHHDLSLDELVWGRLLFSIDHARGELGYEPRYDFDAFLRAWRHGRHDHYPFADEPWWGAQRPPA